MPRSGLAEEFSLLVRRGHDARRGQFPPPICVSNWIVRFNNRSTCFWQDVSSGGEIVVVNAKYGLRILEIVPPPPALTSSLSVNDELPSTSLPRLLSLPPCDIVMRLEDTRWECVPDFWPSWYCLFPWH